MILEAENILMSIEEEKASSFIKRLLGNPSLSTLPVLQREEQIVQFLRINARQLYPTLSSANFFPGKSWENIFRILIKTVIDESNRILFTELDRAIRERIDFAFVRFIEERRTDIESMKEELLAFLKRIMAKPEVRKNFSGPYTSFQKNLTVRYIDEIMERKKYIFFELFKVQKLKMGKEELQNYIKANLLLRPSVHLLTVTDKTEGIGIQSGVVHKQFTDKVFNILRNQLKNVPEALLKSALDSNLSFIEDKGTEATARLTSIFASRGKNYREVKKVERGADSPDKSWFNIARRNYKFYGFDINMLDELYKIAAENGW